MVRLRFLSKLAILFFCKREKQMAQFKYLGEVPRSFVASYGPTIKLAIPKGDGSKTILENPQGFPVGSVIPFDFTDSFSLMFLRNDPRFQEI